MTPESLFGAGGEGGGSAFMRFIYSALAMMGGFITAFDKHDRIRDKFQMDTKEAASPTIETYDFIIGMCLEFFDTTHFGNKNNSMQFFEFPYQLEVELLV